MPGHVLANPVQSTDKVLSLDLCTDWMLAKYAEPTQVLALSPLSKQYPVDWMDQSWSTHDGSLENILDLKPDLVITGEFNALLLRNRLKELGIRVEILAMPTSLSQVNEYEQRLLSLINSHAELSSDRNTTEQNNNTQPKPKLLLLGPNAIGTGRQTFENDLIHHAGWENYIVENGYINLDLEKLSTSPPDAVLWAAPETSALSNLFANHRALKHAIPEKQWLTTSSWKWRCPGPWSWELVKEMQVYLP